MYLCLLIIHLIILKKSASFFLFFSFPFCPDIWQTFSYRRKRGWQIRYERHKYFQVHKSLLSHKSFMTNETHCLIRGLIGHQMPESHISLTPNIQICMCLAARMSCHRQIIIACSIGKINKMNKNEQERTLKDMLFIYKKNTHCRW